MQDQVTVVYDALLHCTAEHSRTGKKLETDATRGFGGKGECYTPIDLTAAALGGCMMIMMGKAAQREGLDILGAKVTVVPEFADMRLAKMKATFHMPRVLPQADRARLEQASQMCPIYRALCPSVEVIVDFVWLA
ncbi:MAG TPA: OsmC family protein [Planctomycetota bacterium]|nr:OsmC family protein [Planctomycetota bacterium]HRR82436.1 OsmC family protein [Planctomycetota bacterium]HRT95706.1 OsmC family protein [Planctomycetota bacterium]